MALAHVLEINTLQIRYLQSLRFVLLKCRFDSTSQNDMKLGQCLDIDAITSPTKFCDFPWPSLLFTAYSVFCRPASYRLVYKIINLCDINLTCLGEISNVNIDNCTKLCEVPCPECAFTENMVFERL